MIRYLAAAIALKAFSAGPPLRSLYRAIGNRAGAEKRVRRGLPSFYLDRAGYLLEAIRKFRILDSGDAVLELGTGWLHWEAVMARLCYDVEVTLFDIWDNRQLAPLKKYYAEFAPISAQVLSVMPAQSVRMRGLLDAIAAVTSFEELYGQLSFRYVVEPSGTLHRFPDEAFRLIVSGNVLQHIKIGILPSYIRDCCRLLKPGGYSIHTIDLGDQLSYYDPSAFRKHYLKFSERTWKLLFENDVQYFNRIQRPAWLDLFASAGLDLVEEQIISEDPAPDVIHSQYRHLSRRDLDCTVLRIVHRKPAA